MATLGTGQSAQSPRAIEFSRNSLVRRGLAVCIVALLIGVIVVLVIEVRHQLEQLNASAATNVQWSLGQAETEVMALQIATQMAILAPDDPDLLKNVRLRFDVVYSRIDTLNRADVLIELRKLPGMEARLALTQAFRRDWVPLIDGPDAALRPALPQLFDQAELVRQAVRALALDGVSFFARAGDVRRIEISRILSSIGMMTVALVGILLILMIAVLRLARQREREARLNHETRERLETIVSTSLDAVVVIDQTDRVIEWNGAAERVFGYTNREAVGAEMSSLIVPEHFRPMHRQAMQRYARTGVGRVVGRGIVQLEARHKDGSIFPVDLSLAEAQGPRGEIFVAFMRDITDRVRAEQALRRARDRAVAGEKQKAELLAVMSHEMRTPLNGILGTLDLCETEQLDEKNRRHLRIIRQSGEVLLSHVNDVLDISRLDAGKMPLRKRRFDLVALMREIIDSQTPRASALGNKLQLLPPSPELHNAYSDPDRLRQILLNLVSNAIKFTRNGRITLEADVSEGLNAVELRVTDTGDGIAAQDLGRIFDDFVTIDSSYGRRNTGTGLGLGISQRLAVALGGELGAESEPGDGSLFWVRLPMDPPADAPVARIPANEPQAAPPRALDVLLVEDNAINREVARQMLERDGHRATITEDGQQGVDAAAVRRFDVILMDISMPGLDGMTAARMIRAGKGPNARTPIVATTAHALPEEVRAFRAAGMDRVLTKPITVASLRRTLTETLGRGGVTTPDPEAVSGGTDASQALAETAPPRIDAAHFREVTEELADDQLRAMLANCAKEIDRFLDHLPEALAAPEPTFGSLSQEAHRLAGSAGVFGALPMAGLLRQFQTMARSEDLAALRTQGRELARCWDETCAELARRGYAEQVDAND